MINETCLKTEMKTIERRRIHEENLEIEYILYQISSESRKYFAIEIVLEEDATLAVLGEDIDEARSFYEESIKGTVTPSGLTQILADRINSIEY